MAHIHIHALPYLKYKPLSAKEKAYIRKHYLEQSRDLLLENIEKVKKDPNYIPQAKAITNNVNSIIGLVGLQIKMMRQQEVTEDKRHQIKEQF